MMHPHSEARPTSTMGLGVFATKPIASGTIVYVADPLERVIEPDEFARMPEILQVRVETYSYISPTGSRILSWDIAKYVNHRCECNSLSTGWGFEIAITDIEAHQEITDDYGMFNLVAPMAVHCGCQECRHVVRGDDFDRHSSRWDALVRTALESMLRVDQPLWPLLDDTTRASIEDCVEGRGPYRSVEALRRVGSWGPSAS